MILLNDVPIGTEKLHAQKVTAGLPCLGKGAGSGPGLETNAPDRPRLEAMATGGSSLESLWGGGWWCVKGLSCLGEKVWRAF